MLRSEKVVLRMIREADLENLSLLDSDIDCRGPYFNPNLQSEVMLRKQFDENGLWDDNAGDLLICSPDNRILGKISFYKTRAYFNAVEVGYILYDIASRGKGVTTEALTLFVDYLFFSKGINRIELVAAVENAASRRVAEKCGFTLEGILRSALTHQGKQLDMALYALLREEAAALKPADSGT